MSRLANRLRLKDLQLIEAIHKTGQLALAAEALGLTQPAASRMLARIEHEVGEKIFLRHPKGMRRTPIGEIVARNAVSLLRGLDETERQINSVSAGFAGTARVGAVTGGALGFVVPAIRALKRLAMGADVHVDVAPSAELIEGLTRGEYDFVLSRIPAGVDARQFSIRRGRVETVSVLVRDQHPLAQRRQVALAELEGFEWVIQASGTPIRQAVEEAFVDGEIPIPTEIVNTTSLLVMIAYLDSTDAIAPVSREVAKLLAHDSPKKGLAALELEEPIIISPYHLIHHRGQVMSPLAARLHDLVVEEMRPTDGPPSSTQQR